jgi:glycosyltransferase involved in cell wall biosynthesis
MAALASGIGDVHIHAIEDWVDNETPGSSSWRLIRREFRYWRAFRRAADEVRSKMPIDAVILPYVDYCFYALSILGSPFRGLPWSGISMRLSVARDASNRQISPPFKWRIAKRVLGDSELKGLYVINPSIRHVPSNWLSTTLHSKLRYLPDPAEQVIVGSRSGCRDALGISEGAVAILVFGRIDERKGVGALLTTLASHDGLAKYVVILAGVRSPSAQLETPAYACLQSQNRLIVIDHYLDEAEQSLVFGAADVVWVGYRNHAYMSGVLVLAGRASLPVIGTAEGEIGRLILEHDLGAVARMDEPKEVALALSTMLDARTRNLTGHRARAVFADHTVENYGTAVLSAFAPH